MPLIEIRTDLTRVADALERIAYLLERLVYPPLPADIQVQQATLQDLHIVTPEDHQRMTEEQAAFAARYHVMPGSEAFGDALADWEAEQRSLYGENWQAPDDWRKVFREAAEATGGRPHFRAAEEAAPGSRGTETGSVPR
jgi:hypothetical protein